MISIKVNDDIIAGTDDLYPEQLKKCICMEECAELIQAISKVQRDRGFDNSVPKWARSSSMTSEHHDNETEKISDVILAINMLMDIDGIAEEEVQWWIDNKQSRQLRRDYTTFRNKYALEFEAGGDPEDFIPDEELWYYKRCKKEFDNYAKNRNAEEAENDVPNE